MRFIHFDTHNINERKEGKMDVTIIFKMAAIGIMITVVCQVLKKSDRDDIATLVSIVGLVIVLAVVVGMIGDLFAKVKEIFELSAYFDVTL